MRANDAAAQSGSSKQLGAKQCAASMAGVPVRIEYDTGSDDGVPFVHLHAVHVKGVRVPIDFFSNDAISDWTRECEYAEITADECPGHPGGRISADDLYRSRVMGPAVIAGAAA